MSFLRKFACCDSTGESKKNAQFYRDIHEWLEKIIPAEQERVIKDATAGVFFSPSTERYAEKNNLWGTPDDKEEIVKQTKSIAKRLNIVLKPTTNMSDFIRTLISKEDELYKHLADTLSHAEFKKEKIEEPHSKKLQKEGAEIAASSGLGCVTM